MSVDLPAPFSPTRAKHLAGLDGQRHAVEGLNAGEVLADVTDFEERRCRHRARRRMGERGA